MFMRKTSTSRKIFVVCNYLIFILVGLTCVLPFVYLFAVSLSDKTAVAAGQVAFWPIGFNLSAYEYAIQGGKFLRALSNSVVLVVVGTTINLILMLLTAYPLSKTKEQLLGRNIYMAFFVITMLINGGMIPTYLVVAKLGLKNTIWSLILPGALPVYNMVILMNFIRGLPVELQDAAKVDGASEVQVLFKILLPLLKPSLATVGLFCIVGHWNNWFGGIIYMNNPVNYPLATYMQTLLTDIETMIREAGSDYSQILSQMNAQTGRAAQLFLGALPVMIIYPFLQKYFTAGLTLGSVKG